MFAQISHHSISQMYWLKGERKRETRHSSPAIIPHYETKHFLPAKQSHNRRVARERARFSADDYSKKASSDYAHLIGWDSHGNCEVNWFLMIGPADCYRDLARFFSILPLFSAQFLPYASFCRLCPQFLYHYYHPRIIIQFRLYNLPIYICNYSNSIYTPFGIG